MTDKSVRYVITDAKGRHVATVLDMEYAPTIRKGWVVDETTEICPPGHRWCPHKKAHIPCAVQEKHHAAATAPTLEERIAQLERIIAERLTV